MKFEDYFQPKYLDNLFNKKLKYLHSTGIDKMSSRYFYDHKDQLISKISEKVLDGHYRFKPYKIMIIPKKINQLPRKICISTISDRLVMEALKNYLYDLYKDKKINESINIKIGKCISIIKEDNYTKALKVDLSSFYDNINHKKLLSILKAKKIDNRAEKILLMLLTNKQKEYSNKKEASKKENQERELSLKNKKGVPQGLCISNLLANIYLFDFDNKIRKIKNIEYIRYVDDILIFHNKNGRLLNCKIKRMLKKLYLKENKKKTSHKILNNDYSLEFLGYSFSKNNISIRDSSFKRYLDSIERLFKLYKNNPKENREKRLKWDLRLKISGAILDDKKYGWLFYFSHITDEKIINTLDNYIRILKRRYNVTGLQTYSFKKTIDFIKYGNIKKKIEKTSSPVLNLNKITNREEKIGIIEILTNYSEENLKKMNSIDLDYLYKKTIFKDLKKQEKDLDNLS